MELLSDQEVEELSTSDIPILDDPGTPLTQGDQVLVALAIVRWTRWGLATVEAVTPGFWDWEEDAVPVMVRFGNGRVFETNSEQCTRVHVFTDEDLKDTDMLWQMMEGLPEDAPAGTPAYIIEHTENYFDHEVAIRVERIWDSAEDGCLMVGFVYEEGSHSGEAWEVSLEEIVWLSPHFQHLDTRFAAQWAQGAPYSPFEEAIPAPSWCPNRSDYPPSW